MYCGNCGASLPPDARFCFVCGAPTAVRAPVVEAAQDPTCRIRLWRGYVKAEFYVELDDPEEGPSVLRSRSFWWRHDTPPPADDEDVRDAYGELVERLYALGWEQVGHHSPWYAQRFRKADDELQAVEEDDGGGRVRDLRKEAP